MMLYLIGPAEDGTTRYFARQAVALGSNVQWLDLSSAVAARWHIDLDGSVEVYETDLRISIPQGAPVYARLISPASDPDLSRSPARRLVSALASWLELSPGRVVNRPGHAVHNSTKPLHEAVLRSAGFDVPPSVTSSDPRRLQTFASGAPVVVKTISGVRADCFTPDVDQLAGFHPEQGPIHLQRAVDGLDLRVHVVGTRVITVAIRSRAVDYRAADDAEYFRFELPASVAQRVIEMTAEMGLDFAGWDFKVSKHDGRYYALEANPMPGYDVYDRAVDREITRALIDHLGSPL
jgi:hypothetical protein